MSAAYARRLWLEDALLFVALGLVLWLRPGGALAAPLAVAITLVIGWGRATLHFPGEVRLSSADVSFSRYGRTHVFRWEQIASVRLRRFLVGDRVLVRILPAPPWRGRYWVSEGPSGHADVVRALARIASEESGPTGRSTCSSSAGRRA